VCDKIERKTMIKQRGKQWKRETEIGMERKREKGFVCRLERETE
jgi:hypothetical protein